MSSAGATRWSRRAGLGGGGERPAPRAAGEVGVDQPAVDAGVLAVEVGRDRLPPALAVIGPHRTTRSLAGGREFPVARGARALGILSACRATTRCCRTSLAAREGDGVAVGELVRLTQPAVWQVCQALGSPGEVEDLVQETYLRALSGLDRYRGEAPVRVWLLSIARRVCADHVRRRQRRRRLADRLARHATATAVPGAGGRRRPAGRLIDGDRREAFVLTQLVGLSYEDAAGVVGCPIGTIRSRVARARADLLEIVARSDAR